MAYFFSITRPTFLRMPLLVVSILLATACSDSVEEATTCAGPGDVSYVAGQTFDDDCNSCTCNEDGSISCTEMACATACEHNGEQHEPGIIPAGDGCNTCVCHFDGTVDSCTEAACTTSCTYAGVQYVAGDAFPAEDGCNTCTCDEGGEVSCTEMAC